MIKKTLCTLLAVLMLLAVLPVSVLAEDGAEDETLPAAEGTDEEVFALGTAAAKAAEIIAEGICGDNAAWTLYDDGHLAVTGSGEMYDRNIDMTSEQKKLVLTAEIGEGITVLGGLLAYCGNMTSVTLPQSLVTIRYNAFYLCENLTDITIPAGVTSIGYEAFADCYKLSALTIPEGVTNIGGLAFYRTALTELTIPASVTEIGLDAFMCCSDLTFLRAAEGSQAYSSDEQGILYNKSGTSVMFCPPGKTGAVTIPEGVTSIEACAFNSAGKVTAITLPPALTKLGSSAFASCLSLESLAIPYGVTELPPDLCAGCEALTAVTIPESVTRIWHGAFSGCFSLASAAIPGNVTSIGQNAFFRCGALTSVAIPASVTEISSDAFSECRSLASFTVADGNTKYSADEQGLLRSKDGKTLYICPCAKEGELIVPAGVTEIGSGALHECRSITSVILPDGLTTIWTDAFSNCFGLKSVTIPKSVSFIGASAFYSCDALEDIYYIGTEGAWGTVEISPIQNEILTGTDIHFLPADDPSMIGCGVCGEHLVWTLTDEGVLTISGKGAMTDYSYGAYADWREFREKITDLVIEEGVTTIGDYAFHGCSRIRNATIPAGILSVGDYAFSTCSALESLSLPASVMTIGESAFESCHSLADIDCPGVTDIGSHAFESCGFRALPLPDSLESIGSGAFDYCSRMRALYIPAGVTAIPASSYANSPFITCSNLTIFCEAEAAPSGWGSCWNNIDYSKKVPVVFGCPKTVYEFWASLDPEAESVVIPDGMTAIPAGICKNFIRLKTVTIPASVTAVGENAFSGCSVLTDVWFGGSAAQWSAISIAGGNTALTGAAMHNISTVASGTCGTNASWTLTNDGVLTISGTGAMADFAPARRPEWESYKAQITSVIVEDGITSVGVYAFYNYAALQSVQLSGTVAKLCESAFYGCTGLKSFTAPAGLTEIGKYAFYACTGMGSVTLPAGLQTIDSYAFQSCKSLKSITIPAGVTTLGSYAFSNCDLLESVLLPDSITVIDTAVFNRCKSLKTMDLPVGVTTIKGNAFNGCTALTSITIPVTVTAFSGTANSVFAGSTNLKDIYYGGSQAQWNAVSNRPNIYWATMHYADFGKGDCGENVQWVLSGDGVLTISGTGAMTAYASAAAVPWNAFRSEIKSVVVESGVTSVSGHAFSDCGKLTSVSLPESVTAVGDAAFSDCGKLTALALPSGLSEIGAGAFRGSALTEITLPAAVTSVGEAAFADCSDLQAIRTEEKATAIASVDGVLYNGSMTVLLGCPAKKSGAITVPAGVTDIGGGAFAGCAGLTEITLPASVASVGADAFSGCSALRSVLYAGSETDRAAMSVNGDGNDILLSSIWHYDDAGHVYDRQVVSDEYKAAEADCTNPMTYYYSCACGEKGSTTFGVGDPLGHSFSEAWSRDAEYHWHAAICAHAQEISGKAAHTWGTPTEDGGTLEFTCTVCDAVTHELAVNAINFPDDGFRGAVAACDADGSGGLSAAEIAAVKTLDCRGLGISDLTGIEYLSELESLSLDGNNISSLDLRGCEKLSSVSFGQQSAAFTAMPCGGSWQIDLGAIFGSGLSAVSVLPADGLDYDAGTGILTVSSDAPFTYTYDTGKGSMTVLASVTLSDGYPALIPGAAEGSVVEIDGISYAAGPDGTVMLPDGSSRLAVTFTYKMDSDDVHTQYPLGMTVYQLAFDGSAYTVEPVDVLCNVLQYAGSSIRITGNKGIRMITSVPDSARNVLISSGTAGMTLLEYGTLVAWDDELCGADLVFGLGYEKSAYAYKRDEADPVFKRANGLTQYTNVLVGFSNEQCVPDLAMRPYMVLEDADGEQIILYGGTVHRSIGYIAWQNRNAFAPGNASYNYIWDIIHFVYGDAFDEDYKG